MDNRVKQEITRLLLEQVAIDEAKQHQCAVLGKQEGVFQLMDTINQSDYRHIHPAWAIELYLRRN